MPMGTVHQWEMSALANDKSIDQIGVVGGLKSSVDSILGLRDRLGAALMPVYLVTRSWNGEEIGDGMAEESKVQILPSPRIVSMSDDSRVVEGGQIQLDDIMLKMVSKVSYPSKSMIDGTSENQTVEMFYEVDGNLYKATNVTEKHLYWNIQIRKLTNQARY